MPVWRRVTTRPVTLAGQDLPAGARLFLWLAARESWKITLGLAVGTYLFFVIAGDLLKLTELDPGLVADSLGVSTLDSFFLDPLFEALSLR